MTRAYSLTEKLWLYPGKAGWYFITIPQGVAKEIDFRFSLQKRGWGSIPVKITVGKTTWRTSIFPDKKTSTYLLPVKMEIRKKELLHENNLVSLTLEISS